MEGEDFPRCECGDRAKWCHKEDLDEQGKPFEGHAFCDGMRDYYLRDGVPEEDMVSV